MNGLSGFFNSKNVIIFFSIIAFRIIFAEESLREWSNSDGRSLYAKYLGMQGAAVLAESENGDVIRIPLNVLSKEDFEYAKKAYEKSLFDSPASFKGDEMGGVIIVAFKGEVLVLNNRKDRYAELTPKPRPAIVGESLGFNSVISTGVESDADLLLTNGSALKLEQNSSLRLNTLWQKKFTGTNSQVNDLLFEASPSRGSMHLERGELVVDVKKLRKESSFVITTDIAHAGIRGTSFKLVAKPAYSELAVLDGVVTFMTNEEAFTNVEALQKAEYTKNAPLVSGGLKEDEKKEIQSKVMQIRKSSAEIDLNRLANTVSGNSRKRNYTVESADNLEMIWCPPGGFLMNPQKERDLPAKPIVFEQGFYLGKYELTKGQYSMALNKSEVKPEEKDLPQSLSWNQSKIFCEKLTEMEKSRLEDGWAFTIPSIEEWEYACRAGTTTRFSWGDKPSKKLANYTGSKAVKVGSFPPNLWGFYEMHGNLWEWNLNDASNGKTIRGGSYSHPSNFMTSSRISSQPAGIRHPILGMRLALKKLD